MNILIHICAVATKRLMILGTFGVGLLPAGLAYAAPTVFGENDTLTAAALNGNFAALQAEVDGLKADVATLKAAAAKQSQNGTDSAGATFKGVSVP